MLALSPLIKYQCYDKQCERNVSERNANKCACLLHSIQRTFLL